MKDGIENSWAPHPGFEPPPSVQQAGALPLDHSAALMTITMSVIKHCDVTAFFCIIWRKKIKISRDLGAMCSRMATSHTHK